MKDMKIRVCIPFYNNYEAAKSFFENDDIKVVARQGTYIWQVRNHLIGDGSNKPVDVDAFVFIDSDVHGQPERIKRLIKSGKDIVGGCYRQHRTNYAYAWKDNRALLYNNSGMQEVDAVGTGFMFIKREVLEDVGYPWFYHPYLPEVSEHPLSEDINFCRMARRKGHKVYCDFDNKVGHVERTINNIQW